MSLGGPEILVIFFIALLVFGPDKLPSMMKTVGQTVAELKKYQNIAKSEIDKAINMASSDSKDSSSHIETSNIRPEQSKITNNDQEITKDDKSNKTHIEKVMPIIDDEPK
ncbi:MAG: twin-arginine translocase TatA/TatE family subunit [Acidimicrobiia bacterium]|nr:twin-arginine translocase TatA/TatE family subunit [Acidimicrobiia bacterium]